MEFSGSFTHTIDGKGRVSIPAGFRDQLLDDHRLVLVPVPILGQRCVDIHPYGEWQTMLRKLEGRPKFNTQNLKFQMVYVGRAHRAEIDSAGRVLVPPAVREYAGLKRDVVVMGQSNLFRLMDEETYRKVMGELDAEAAGDPSLFEDLDL
ncbi:MAG: division/cell wall cluster transcriptional repressor MraZ [Deltaproteobacteria bacterium]|nr:division/cell wall cluster transcriptional repressor MraZ [Deltaproteobacteria bacterium]